MLWNVQADATTQQFSIHLDVYERDTRCRKDGTHLDCAQLATSIVP